MEIEVRIYDGLEEKYVPWKFRVNKDCFVDLLIEERVTDTLYQMGFVTESAELLLKVEYLLSAWKIQWQEMTVVGAH